MATLELPSSLERRAPRLQLSPATVVVGCLVAAALCGAAATVSKLTPVLVAAGIVLAVAAWRAPIVSAVVVVAVCPALSGVSRSATPLPLKVSEVLLLVAAASVLARRPPGESRWRAAEWLLALFALTGAAFAAYHIGNGDSGSGTFVRVGLQPALLFLTWWTAQRSTRNEDELHLLLRWTVVGSLVPAAIAIVQTFDIGSVRQLVLDYTDGGLPAKPGETGVVRATGPFPIWHSLAAYLLPIILLVIALLLRDVRGVLSRSVLVGVLAVDVSALILSLTITVLLWVIVGVLVVAFLQRQLAKALLLLVGVCLVGGVLFNGAITSRYEAQSRTEDVASSSSGIAVPETLAYRMEVWRRDYVPLVNQAIPTGLGNELPDSVLFVATENQYLTYLIRGGIWLVLAAIAAVAAVTARMLSLTRRTTGTVHAVAVACVGVLAFLPVSALVWPYATNAGLPQMLFSLAGAAAGVAAAQGLGGRARSVVAAPAVG